MRKVLVLLLGVVLLQVVSVAQASPQSSDAVIKFTSMVAVTGPFLGATNPIRGVTGGGLPWVVTDVRGLLNGGGHLRVHVTGLVLADDPAVPENLRLTNPLPTFRATISCLTIDGLGNPAEANVSTDDFPASPAGDSKINADLGLPAPCIAPIIFVTTSRGSWLAVTGH